MHMLQPMCGQAARGDTLSDSVSSSRLCSSESLPLEMTTDRSIGLCFRSPQRRIWFAAATVTSWARVLWMEDGMQMLQQTETRQQVQAALVSKESEAKEECGWSISERGKKWMR
jgi:hypothetical protein